ncbi:NAD-dependent epimerase/dehydratase family protein [Bartonella apis]|uniref:NAD-dependent epimerase/dehydratase family protein n=1 Tax=Bartonella apis TaxID=1686310 RepID=UPI001CEC4034|nr:NAD-dependent epimerase/dehydratase family protein [Bartonella apis]
MKRITKNEKAPEQFMMLGAGYSARAFASLYGAHVANTLDTAPSATKSRICGTTRTKEKFTSLENANIEPFLFDEPTPTFFERLETTTNLVISVSPDETMSDAVLNRSDILGSMPQLKWIGYLSTIGVYGNHDGGWIDEEAPCHPSLERNISRLEVEKKWQAFGNKHNIPVAILRLGGIYGPSRNPFMKLRQGNKTLVIKKGQFFNRIHVDDIAGVIKAFSSAKREGIFNIVDNEPAPPEAVMHYAAKLMRVTDLEEVPFEKADMSPMARSFYGDNKRILNHKLLKTGYNLKYPDYRTALEAMWKDNLWDKKL